MAQRRSMIRASCCSAILVALAACTGEVGMPTSGSPSGGTGSTGTGAATGGGTTTGGGTNGPSSLLGLADGPTPTARLHKLTTFEFANSLHDLLGSAAPVAPVETDYLVNGFATIGASTVTASPAGVGLYETSIAGATTYAFADATRAAAQDSLATPDGIRAQATRMLADQRVHRALASFVDQLFEARLVPEADKDAQIYPAWTPTLRSAMQQEVQLRFDDLVYGQKGDYLGIFESRSTFVNNELARFYGVPEAMPDTFHKVDLPANSPRVGLLGAGMVLAIHARPQRTSPTLRGRFVNQMLLCRTIPPPPPGVPPFPDGVDANSTVRDRLTMHRSAASCAACHGIMDPIGFGMENFDSSGKYQ